MKTISFLLALLVSVSSFAATVNVLDYGAIANDGKDDTAAIRSAITASVRGDTISFPPGQLDLTGIIRISGGRTYAGVRGQSVLRLPLATVGARSAAIFELDPADAVDVSIQDITFDGNGILLDRTGGWPEGIRITYCSFTNAVRSDADPHAIYAPHGLKNASIKNCTFTNWKGYAGIRLYGFQSVDITDNSFDDIEEGIHVLSDYGPCTTLAVQRNTLRGVRRMGIEIRGTGPSDSVLVERNDYREPDLTGDLSNTYAISVWQEKCKKVVIQRNYILATERPDGIGVRRGIEVGGNSQSDGVGPVVTQNRIEGTNHSIAVCTSVGAKVVSNRIINVLQVPSIADGLVINPTFDNNLATTTLDWLVDDVPVPGGKTIKKIIWTITYTDDTSEQIER